MFKRVLVANRGEIAGRILRTCERLGIETVAVFSDADARSPHVALADQAVRIGPPPVKDSYLDVAALVFAIEQTRADAVHPGYGLLSENAAFAEAVARTGAVFIGPNPDTLRTFGDKLQARALARSLGVLPPPGSDGPLDPEDQVALGREAERIGYPVLVKAAGGGGGIGMQVVDEPARLAAAVRSCSDRGRAAFGDPRVYLERYLSRPRHIEVQVLRDTHGKVVALGDRECSVQRRHQKIVEEALSPAAFLAAGTARAELYRKATSLVEAASYVGAGTVEFVADAGGQIYFLEVNARLQVEHPVTELVTGLDLVEAQLRIAAGEGLSPAVLGAECTGHAIEARLYAEDPEKNFLPQPGRVDRLVWPEPGQGVRVDSGIVQGGEVTPHYDPLLAKIAAWGATRDEARLRLDAALAATELDLVGPKGPRRTNLAFLRRVLGDARFVSGEYDTGLVAGMLSKQS